MTSSHLRRVLCLYRWYIFATGTNILRVLSISNTITFYHRLVSLVIMIIFEHDS